MLGNFRSLGWEPLSHDDYGRCWHRHGGSVISHPAVLAFIESRFDCNPARWGRRNRKGELIGAIATWGNFLAGDKSAMLRLGLDDRHDFGSPELILPLSPEFHGPILYRGKFVSPVNAPLILNATTKGNGRSLCFAKPLEGEGSLSGRTRQRRRSQTRHLCQHGGQIRNIDTFTPRELADLYAVLFEKRWQRPMPTLDGLHEYFDSLAPYMTGHVILIDGAPAAYQLLLATRSSRFLSVEYINGGVDPAHGELSPGTVLTWLNVESCWNAAKEAGLALRYSFGRNSFDYKAQWAHEAFVSRTVTF
ncbi:GNAT family N-acetyltransferase [Paludibacterium paludis]|uniref:Mig-14 protein n=1 Tax=Paludibacterium paludis TaxID=1225769 RepID=A0A918NZY1_9NEIS|nr:GNAT family N-acetyltransferase [Paludibacterium paludis]GGY08152.1 hypothetical protein GCM10011289_08500 [Paludibacterium paludis]